MAITRRVGGGGDCGRQGRRNLKDSCNGDVSTQRQSPFGSCADSDLISCLREMAVNPCYYKASKESEGRLCDQLLKLRKIMFLTHSEFPRVISNLVYSPCNMSSHWIQISYHTCIFFSSMHMIK